MSSPNPATPGLPTPPPTIGVDPGAVWTAAVLRIGDYPEYGWTMGPVDRFGMPDRAAVNDIDDWPAVQRYLKRVVAALDELVEYGTTKYGAVRVGIEIPRVPIGWQPGTNPRYNRLPQNEWIMPKLVTAAVIAVYPEARLVLPDKLGRRPAGEYPREVRGTRPPNWGPNEDPKRDRQHERSAYDVAGLAMTQP